MNIFSQSHRYKVAIKLFLVFLLAIFWKTIGAQVDLKIVSDTSQIAIGSKTTLLLRCSQDPEAYVKMPQYLFLWHDSLDIEVIESTKWDTVETKPLVRLEKSLIIMPFELDDINIGPLELVYRYHDIVDTAVSNIATLQVVTDVEEEESLIDIKDIERVKPIHPAWWIFLALLILALLWYFGRRFVRKKEDPIEVEPTPVEVVIDPLEEAKSALSALRKELTDSPMQPKAFHTETSRILKIFLGRVFDIALINKSTSETISDMGKLLTHDELADIQRLLSESDLVKFAGKDSLLDGQISITAQLGDYISAIYDKYYKTSQNKT